MEFQAVSNSYQKALAKGQHEMKSQSFWPTNVILANTCLLSTKRIKKLPGQDLATSTTHKIIQNQKI